MVSVGFLNPILYGVVGSGSSSRRSEDGSGNNGAGEGGGVFNDVKEGRNPGCQSEGFGAEVGWDAFSGLGSLSYEELRKLVGLGE